MLERIPAILIALTIHELAHGYIAFYLGDDTAKKAGRLTLNPIAHLDIFGSLMLLFGPFGWAKPVPVNPLKLKNPKRDMALVAIAGPLSNIILAFLVGILFKFQPFFLNDSFSTFLYIFFIMNIGLAFFNLLPIYPLDGSRILMAFLGEKELFYYLKAMQFIPKIFLIMITAEWLLKIPIFSFFIMPIFKPILQFAHNLFIG